MKHIRILTICTSLLAAACAGPGYYQPSYYGYYSPSYYGAGYYGPYDYDPYDYGFYDGFYPYDPFWDFYGFYTGSTTMAPADQTAAFCEDVVIGHRQHTLEPATLVRAPPAFPASDAKAVAITAALGWPLRCHCWATDRS